MRIGLVTDFYYPWIAGPSIVVRSLAQGFTAHGHQVAILAPSPDGTTGEESEGGWKVTRVSTIASPVGYGLRFSIAPVRQVDRWLQSERPDVVHLHHPFPISAAALWAARRRRIPVVATNHTIPACSLWGLRSHAWLHDSLHAAFSRWLIYLLDRCARVATPTATAATALRDLGFRGRVHVISNGIDCRRFKPGPPDTELRERLGLDERPIVLYTGRLDAEKQIDIWLEAAAELARLVDAQFVIGGQGTEKHALKRLAERLGVSRRVRFVGYLADHEFPSIYRLASVYFITSPVELQSISTLEAIASGLPVVAARAGALPELVTEQQNGYLVAPGDWRAAAVALGNILTDPQQLEDFGRCSRETALRHELAATVTAYEDFLVGSTHAGDGVGRIEHASFAG